MSLRLLSCISRRALSQNIGSGVQKKLFTPGPLMTSMPVKEAMLRDIGSRDVECINIVKSIRQRLVEIGGGSTTNFTCIPMQGSGTYGVEAVLQTGIARKETRPVVILENGAYGKRMQKMLQVMGVPHKLVSFPEDSQVDVNTVRQVVGDGSGVSLVAVVHSETSTGIVNPIAEIGEVLSQTPQRPFYFIDAMSSYGAIPISLEKIPIDFLVSSANKCFEGVPGFTYVIARLESLKKCAGNSRSLTHDLHDQWAYIDKSAQFRFAPPTHSLLAFHKALDLYDEEGGLAGRRKRYLENRRILREGMARLGFKEYLVPPALTEDSYIITSFHYPEDKNFDFEQLYTKLSDKGFVIYPGKVATADLFRIGTIGHLFPNDFVDFLKAMETTLNEMGVSVPVSY